MQLILMTIVAWLQHSIGFFCILGSKNLVAPIFYRGHKSTCPKKSILAHFLQHTHTPRLENHFYTI